MSMFCDRTYRIVFTDGAIAHVDRCFRVGDRFVSQRDGAPVRWHALTRIRYVFFIPLLLQVY